MYTNRIRPYRSGRAARFANVVLLMLVLASTASTARADPPQSQLPPVGEPDRNIRLRAQLDRTTVKAYEPVYIGLSAEQFAQTLDLGVQIKRDEGPWQPLTIPAAAWPKSQVPTATGTIIFKMGTMLLSSADAATADKANAYLFATPGDYKIRVKVGPDSTTLSLKVVPGEPNNDKAFQVIGADLFGQVFAEEMDSDPAPKLLAACAVVLKDYPGTTAAKYCKAYVATANFRAAFKKHKRSGGKEVYTTLVNDLSEAWAPLADSFYGEELSLYLAYAKGLCKDFVGVIKTCDDMRTRVTPWSGLVDAMKGEVIRHTQPVPGVSSGRPHAP